MKGTYDTDAAGVLNEYLFNGQPGQQLTAAADSFIREEYETFAERIKKISMTDIRPSCRSK